MKNLTLRRSLLALSATCLLALSACGGGGDIVDQLVPNRIVSFGDGFSDLGQGGGGKYTVNDGSVNNWTSVVANSYGLPLTPQSAGGQSWARGNARIALKPDAAGVAATLTVREQIDAFLAAGPVGARDLILLSGGFGDVIAEVGRFVAGAQTREQLFTAVTQAGTDLASQARRLSQAGARYVTVAGVYDLGRSPWAARIGQQALLTELSIRFNDAFKVAAVDLGSTVFFVDTALYFNLLTGDPGSFGLNSAVSIACSSVDAGAGIGTGSGQVNSRLCTSATIASGVDFNRVVFADSVYPTPVAHRLFGDNSFQRISQRF